MDVKDFGFFLVDLSGPLLVFFVMSIEGWRIRIELIGFLSQRNVHSVPHIFDTTACYGKNAVFLCSNTFLLQKVTICHTFFLIRFFS